MTAGLVGLLAVALAIELVAMSGHGTRSVWVAAWWVLAGVGGVTGATLIPHVRQTDWRTHVRNPFLWVALGANLVTLLIAAAPSSKIDELYYHMLTPRRMLDDGTIRFYRYPWEGAILLQMHYQIAAVLPHALGFGDGPNVTSWWFAVVLQLFTWDRVRAVGHSPSVAAACTAVVAVGMVPAVWFVTGGAHAVGYLATTALIVAAVPGPTGQNLLPATGSRRVAVGAILACAAVATKITFVPLAGFCLGWIVFDTVRTRGGNWKWGLGAILAAVFLALGVFGPLMVLTARESGSPFAFVLPGSTGASAYTASEAVDIPARTRQTNQAGIRDFILYTGLGGPVVIWIAAIAVLLARDTPDDVILFWASVTFVAFGLIFTVTHNDVRFTGGYTYAALILAASAFPGWSDRCRRPPQGLPVVPAVTPNRATSFTPNDRTRLR